MRNYYKLLAIIACLFIDTGVFAQEQRTLDSLWNIWEDATLKEKTKGIALYRYAEAYQKTQPDSTLKYARMALDYSKEQQLDSLSIRSIMLSALAYKNADDTENSLDHYDRAIALAREKDETRLLAVATFHKGKVYYANGNYGQALELYLLSQEPLDTPEHNALKGSILNNVGIIHIIQQDFDKAEAALEHSIALYESSKKPEERNGPIVNYGILKRRQGDYQGAIELYMQSLAIQEEHNDLWSVAKSYQNIANLYFQQKDWDKFYEYSYKALDIRKNIDDKEGIVTTTSSLAVAHMAHDEDSLALELFNSYLPIAREIEDQLSVAHALTHIGLAQTKLGMYDEALPNIEEALELSQRQNNLSTMTRSYAALGLHAKETGNNSKARAYFQKALDMAKPASVTLTNEIAYELFLVDEATGRNADALEMYKLYIETRDSIQNQENDRAMIRQEYKYEYGKKALADSLSFESQKQIQAAELEKTNSQKQMYLVLLLAVLGFAGLLYNRIRLVKKKNQTIATQNDELSTLTGELQELNENLEHKVEERTREVVAANKSLKESDERYAYAMEASNDGIWDYDVPNDKIKFSPAIYTMLGYEPNGFPEAREGIYELLHPEDKKAKTRAAHNLFLSQHDKDYMLDEYRLIGKKGNPVWVQVKGKVVERDQNNAAIRVIGTHTDITAAKLKNQEMLEAVLRTEDTERSRIAQEIHDGLQQTLTVSYMNLNNLNENPDAIPKEFEDHFNLGWEYLVKSIKESRSVAHALMPKAIMDFGILSACETLVEDMNKSSEETKFIFQHNLDQERLNYQQIEITLYRILQESLNNVLKYAKASEVLVQLYEHDNTYSLTVEDNGVGFDLERMEKGRRGLGFKSMKNRLDAVNGSLEIDTAKGEGTTIMAEIEK